MTATLVNRNSPILSILGAALACLSIGVKAAEAIPAGVIGAIDTSGRLVNATASASLRIVGRVEEAVLGSAVDLAVLGKVQPGCFLWENSAAADAIAADDIGKPCYVVDNQTVALTDAAGTRPFAGVIVAVVPSSSGAFDAVQGGVYVAMLGFYDSLQATKNEAGGAGVPFVQAGTGVLVAGVLAVTAGVQITANSRIVACIKTPGGTFSDGGLDIPSGDRVVGEPGVGAFTIRALVQAGTANVADTSTVDWIVVG